MILDELAAYASFRVAEAKKKIAADEMERKARSLPKGDFRFEHALCNTEVSFICEVKRASPSKGLIAEGFLMWRLPENMSRPVQTVYRY